MTKVSVDVGAGNWASKSYLPKNQQNFIDLSLVWERLMMQT